MSTSTERLLDELEVRHLSHRYAQAVDRGDRAAWSALFAPDATLKVGSGEPLGYDKIVGIPERQLKRYKQTWHGVLTQVIDLDGDAGVGEVYCVARHIWTDYHNTPGSMPFTMSHDITIRYQDRYRKDDGVWRFAQRELIIDFRDVSQVDLFSGSVPV